MNDRIFPTQTEAVATISHINRNLWEILNHRNAKLIYSAVLLCRMRRNKKLQDPLKAAVSTVASLWQPVQWLAERMMSTSIIHSLQKTYRLTRKLLTCGRINTLTFWLHIVTDSCWKHCATVEPEVTCGQLCYHDAIAFISWIYYLFGKMELKYFQENLLAPSQDDY